MQPSSLATSRARTLTVLRLQPWLWRASFRVGDFCCPTVPARCSPERFGSKSTTEVFSNHFSSIAVLPVPESLPEDPAGARFLCERSLSDDPSPASTKNDVDSGPLVLCSSLNPNTPSPSDPTTFGESHSSLFWDIFRIWGSLGSASGCLSADSHSPGLGTNTWARAR